MQDSIDDKDAQFRTVLCALTGNAAARFTSVPLKLAHSSQDGIKGPLESAKIPALYA